MKAQYTDLLEQSHGETMTHMMSIDITTLLRWPSNHVCAVDWCLYQFPVDNNFTSISVDLPL